MQQGIATGKSRLYSTKFHIVPQNASKVHSKEQLFDTLPNFI